MKQLKKVIKRMQKLSPELHQEIIEIYQFGLKLLNPKSRIMITKENLLKLHLFLALQSKIKDEKIEKLMVGL
jgi:hypothetical protein